MTTRSPDPGFRVALVTGGGRGLGAAYVRALAARGAAVVVNDTGVDLEGAMPDPAVAQAMADEIVDAGGQAVADTSDVAGFAGGSRAVERALSTYGRLDILINNAGTFGGGDLEELTEDEFSRQLAVHVLGTLGTLRAALPLMQAQGYGRVVNTTSEAALSGVHGAGWSYGAGKAAVWGITRAAAAQCAGSGVSVNAVSPGAMTRMSRAHLEAAGVPAGLDLSPDRVAEVVVALCTEGAGDINGRVVHTAGGHIREYVLSRLDVTDLSAVLVSLSQSGRL